MSILFAMLNENQRMYWLSHSVVALCSVSWSRKCAKTFLLIGKEQQSAKVKNLVIPRCLKLKIFHGIDVWQGKYWKIKLITSISIKSGNKHERKCGKFGSNTANFEYVNCAIAEFSSIQKNERHERNCVKFDDKLAEGEKNQQFFPSVNFF